MLRWKLPPVWVDELQNVLWDAIEVGGALGVDQVVLGIHVDAMFWFPGHAGQVVWSDIRADG